MICLHCNGKTKVIDIRKRKWSMYMRQSRRRECLGCKRRFTTHEYYETDYLIKSVLDEDLSKLQKLTSEIENKIINFRTRKRV